MPLGEPERRKYQKSRRGRRPCQAGGGRVQAQLPLRPFQGRRTQTCLDALPPATPASGAGPAGSPQPALCRFPRLRHPHSRVSRLILKKKKKQPARQRGHVWHGLRTAGDRGASVVRELLPARPVGFPAPRECFKTISDLPRTPQPRAAASVEPARLTHTDSLKQGPGWVLVLRRLSLLGSPSGGSRGRGGKAPR